MKMKRVQREKTAGRAFFPSLRENQLQNEGISIVEKLMRVFYTRDASLYENRNAEITHFEGREINSLASSLRATDLKAAFHGVANWYFFLLFPCVSRPYRNFARVARIAKIRHETCLLNYLQLTHPRNSIYFPVPRFRQGIEFYPDVTRM